MDKPTAYTIHGVLGGAYRNGNLSALLHHASLDGGEKSLCRKVKTGNLCDEYGTELGQAVDCPTCMARIAKRGLVAAD